MVNRVILIGNLGKDPEIKVLDNGINLTRFSLATSENYKDKSGEWQQQTEWHDIVFWRQQAEYAAEKLKKGDSIYLEGKLTHRNWEDKEGNKRRNSEVVGNYFRKLNKSEAAQYSQPEVKSNVEANSDLPF